MNDEREEQLFNVWIAATGLHINEDVRGCMLIAWKTRATLANAFPTLNNQKEKITMNTKKTTIDYHSFRVGSAKAFGTWKLIWNDTESNTFVHTIPAKTAKALIAAGMNYEG